MFNFEYIGNLHIHSRHSDGAGEIEAIAGLAADAGLDFIGINDHDFLKESFDLKEEGFYGKVMVLVGMEIGKRDHHYLAYNIREMIRSNGLEPQGIIDRVEEQGGFGFLAHPFEKGMPFRENSIAYTWNDLSVSGYSGICLWNFSSRWKESIKGLVRGLFFLAFKTQTLKGPSRETRAFWDDRCQYGRVGVIGGSDAHGTDFRWGPLRFKPLPYDFLLRTINVHVLLNRQIYKEFDTAKQDIYEAMKEGRLFIAHDGLASAKGFRFYFISEDGSDLVMGEEDRFQPGTLVVELPDNGEIRLVKNGRIEMKWRGTEAVYRVNEKGVYRVEVYRRLKLFGWRPWIFSNPIYLR